MREETRDMPIYEFYCPKCNVLFNFFSKTVNTTGRPDCPKCRGKRLTRQISMFAAVGRAKEDTGMGGDDDLPIDDAKMERAMESLAGEAEGLDENDPRQAAHLMRKFSDMTGMEFKENMKTAIERMEAGEDPEAIEQEMGGMMDDEDPFVMPGKKEKTKAAGRRRPPPGRDPALYEM